MNLYQFKMKNIDREEVDFSKYKNKVVLIVNVASKCGFAKQYEALEQLNQKYKDQGLCILGFPSDQFKQEFKDENEIKNFCSIKYNVTFEIFATLKVKGEEISPLYSWLISHYKNKNVKWNFEKFLINKNGEVIERYSSIVKPTKIEPKIIRELKKG
ncbi:MAG: glutathione peroxidase [Mycoplasmoidaceae bacterium]